MGLGKKLALIAGIAATATAATAQPAQKVTGPIAVYWMSAQTQTGFGMPAMGAAGGGGRPDTGAIMRAMMGGGGAANKSLTLQLGSSQTNPSPAAEHLPPQGLQAGPSLPLLSPKKPPPPEPETPTLPREYQKPRGKMLIFWGCGEHAKPGQPVVIDFSQLDPARMQAGQIPPGFAALSRGFGVTPMRPPSPSRNTTYGEWPNEKTRTQVPSGGSLIGEHTIQGNYNPQIRFALNEDQDFLGPLNLTTNAKAPGGWVNLGWNLVGNAEAYLATAMGGSQDTVVMWTSSETQAAAFAMPDYLSHGDMTRLVASKALMGPATRACAVPKEALDAMPQGIVQLVAYGGEANFVYPPRPSDPKVAWNQEWAVKVRYRSSTGGLLGMAMPDMGGARYGESGQAPGQPPPGQKPQKPPSASDILKKGILGGFGVPRP
jgi:hypothetical protein